MTLRQVRRLSGLVLVAHLSAAGPAFGQASRVVLDVPYITQTPALCGGAALAMVFRYWGDRAAVAEDFQSLVDRKQNGIPTSALARAAAARGWRAAAATADGAAGTMSDLARAVDLGWPPIVLLEVAAKTYHYVVVVAVTDRDVVIHDPASRPFETTPVLQFNKAWRAAGSWALVVLPATDAGSAPPSRTTRTAMSTDDPAGVAARDADAPCASLVAQAVASANTGDRATSERHLNDATSRCPQGGAAWRELAGLRFVNAQWEDARAMAQKAVALAPLDTHAWQILGASLYLQGHAAEALRSWNRAGDPKVSEIRITGADRTRLPVIVDRLGVVPGELLTPAAFLRAARRAADLPALTGAVVRYVPDDDSDATLEVDVNERQRFPWGLKTWASVAGRALFIHEAEVSFANLTGGGERLDLEYGWKRNHPRSAIRLTAPAPGLLPGLMVVELGRSRQTFAGEGQFGSSRIIEDREGVRIGLKDWATNKIHWNVDGHYNRLEQGTFVAIGAGLDTRLRDDRVALLLDWTAWSSLGEAPGFQTTAFAAKWRQRVQAAAGGFSAEAGATLTGSQAPLFFWPGADVSPNREAYLRAHKLLTDGVVTGAVFGRRLAFASATYEHPLRDLKFGTATAAAFVDTATAWDGMVLGRRASHTDVGLGLRFHSPSFGSVRVDVAYGLRDGATAVSAAFIRPWPGR